MGGRTLNIRHTVGRPESPILIVSSGSAQSEILLNKDHPLYVQASERGAAAVADLVEPLLMETLVAHRLSLDGQTDYSVIREMTDEKLQELARLRQR
jgi:hypothetical protein